MKTNEMLKEIEKCLLNGERNNGMSVRIPLPLMSKVVEVLENLEETVNDDYERSEVLTYLHNGWLERRNTTVLFNMTVLPNGIVRVFEVEVPTDWLTKYVKIKFHEKDLNKFLDTYGCDEVQAVFRDSTRNGVCIKFDVRGKDKDGKKVL